MHKEPFVDSPVSCSNIDAAFPAIGEEETARISTPRSEGIADAITA